MAEQIAHTIFEVLNADRARPLLSGETTATTGDLAAMSTGFAAALREHGCGQGDRVVLCLQSNTDMLAGILGCWMIGVAPLPLDFRTPGSQRAAIAGVAGARLSVETRRPPDADGYRSAVPDEGWWRMPSVAPKPVDLSDDTTALLAMSSGTGGAPRIYLQSHRWLRLNLRNRASRHASTAGLFLTPMSIALSGTRTRVIATLLNGGRVHFMPSLFSTDELIEALASTRANGTALPPPVIARMVRAVGERRSPLFPDLALLRSTGGPALPEDKVAAYRFLSPGYCMAYASNLTTAATMLAGRDVLDRPETVGRPLPGIRIDIIEPATGAVLPAGEPGLIRVHTPYLSDATIGGEGGRADDSERRGEGWGMPGDLGVLDEGGFLTIVGREADMIVRGGVNVAPQEIEAILRRHPDVVDVAVAGIADPLWGQEIIAAIVARSGSEADFHAFCMRHIPPGKRPRIIRMVAALPYGEAGKLQRARLADLVSDGKRQP